MAAIERALQKSSGAIITPSEMATLTYLAAHNRRDISDLTGLEYATSLTGLRLSVNRISDISALSGLTSLETLFLSHNPLSDISALSGLISLDYLHLKSNSLNYPSLTTHIPALQSQGVYVSYDTRTLTSLVKISGDDQTGTAGTRLSDPLIVEVRDENDVAFAGVPVAFSVTAGGGSLSATTATTDANGRVSTMLKLGTAGVNTVVAAIDVSDIDKSVTFTTTATGETTVAGATISSTVPAALTEANLDGATVNITLTGTTYNETLAASHFALHTAPQGASISGTPVRTSDTVAQLTLAYAGLGFDANQNLRVTVKAAAHSGSEDLTTGSVTVTPAQGPGTVVTELGQVTGVAVAPGVGYLAVSWTVVTGATGYKVQWKSGDEEYASGRQQAIDNGGKTSTTIAGLTAGTQYTVRVIATKTDADDGSPSVDVTGMPTAGTQPPNPPPSPPDTTASDPSFGSLTVTAQRYQQGTTIAPLTLPFAIGGDGTLTYTLKPDLPSGLTFDGKTRVLSGTPRELMGETEYTLTATNAEGDATTLTFTISVVADRLPSFDTSTRIAAQSYTIGDSVRVTLPEATGGDGTLVYILLPYLPNGLRFDSATRTISGRPSRVLAETEHTLSALDADGDIASLTFPLEVQQPTADFDGNGRVDIADFWFFTFHYGMRRGDAGYDARYDLDSDGAVGFSDYLIFAENFGTGS